MSKKIRKRSGRQEQYDFKKIINGIEKAFVSAGHDHPDLKSLNISEKDFEGMTEAEEIRDKVEHILMGSQYKDVAKKYIIYRNKHTQIRDYVRTKQSFIEKYKKSQNTANSTIDDNSNVGNKNVAVLNAEIHKPDNILISREMITNKLHELYPDFDEKSYIKDLEHHIIYKHDESSFGGAIAAYCVSISMYPFLLNGIKDMGGLSAAPKNLDSYCGMLCNLVFAVSSQFAGAVAVPEALLYFDYFTRKEWGDDYWMNPDLVITQNQKREKTIRKQIHQHFQQIVYTINQTASGRNGQCPFTNFCYYDRPFFESMFENFVFPDMTVPQWESLNWLQKEFMMWFNAERLRCLMTFPVESFALIYKDGEFQDKENAEFVAEEWARGHSFFLYISDTADSLSSCCFDEKTRIMYSVPGSNTFNKCEEIGIAYKKHKNDIVEVLGYNPYTNKREWMKAKFVKSKSNQLYKITFDNRADWTEMVCTHDHIFPVLRNEKYIDVEVKNIKIGDKLLADKSQWNLGTNDLKEIIGVEIKSIIKIDGEQDVFCLKMEDENSPYFVLSNGIITHNCRLRNKIQTKEFSFTNGNMGVETGSKSVITLNLSRLVQDCVKLTGVNKDVDSVLHVFKPYLKEVLERVYKYHIAYNELLWDMYDADLLSVYKAGFISLNKQYLTIGLNGLNQAAEFIGLDCTDNEEYARFCREIFSTIKESNQDHGGIFNNHKLSFNTELVPAESLAIKNYNWDKEDGYWVPSDTNLYASYVYKPNDERVSILEKIRMHGNNYIGDNLDGGVAAHLNLSEHLSKEQYIHMMKYAAENGCSYLTLNVPNSECQDCGFITKVPINKCPRCESERIDNFDRVIGYLVRIRNWSEGRQIEQKTRVYSKMKDINIK